ncbi:hypothetical protein COCSADRAFT_155188 [Bipolaris sorokiniana ND90Pr]|uniref:Uncharacterized protein n=1 Tax=Cochliobolus sativus (strain ND90Pr / ATCC 201652) TaxID=665912 RepID=M2SP28_COCSN|nr:uncharacterized protein COCSADRAFT_155188 [Bipolaris sorokiniana ND90Pr]EMD68953.1 hypothetical protein COCSADRAFT_155188 [Bipolaris sorokiniana ND90Pr]
MNAAKSNMENLNKEDVQLLCSYRRIYAPIVKQSRSLDFTVVKELVKVFWLKALRKLKSRKDLPV